MNDAAGRALGRVLMITGTQAWRDMPDGGAAALYEELPTLAVISHERAFGRQCLAADELTRLLQAGCEIGHELHVHVDLPGRPLVQRHVVDRSRAPR